MADKWRYRDLRLWIKRLKSSGGVWVRIRAANKQLGYSTTDFTQNSNCLVRTVRKGKGTLAPWIEQHKAVFMVLGQGPFLMWMFRTKLHGAQRFGGEEWKLPSHWLQYGRKMAVWAVGLTAILDVGEEIHSINVYNVLLFDLVSNATVCQKTNDKSANILRALPHSIPLQHTPNRRPPDLTPPFFTILPFLSRLQERRIALIAKLSG